MTLAMQSGTLVPAARKVIPMMTSGIPSVNPITVTCDDRRFNRIKTWSAHHLLNRDIHFAVLVSRGREAGLPLDDAMFDTYNVPLNRFSLFDGTIYCTYTCTYIYKYISDNIHLYILYIYINVYLDFGYININIYSHICIYIYICQ